MDCRTDWPSGDSRDGLKTTIKMIEGRRGRLLDVEDVQNSWLF